MYNANPKYVPFVGIEKGQKVLHICVLQAIYGFIESAFLWYNLNASTLKKLGLLIDPYVRWIVNKAINGKQCTLTCYVDDNKLSYKDPKVVTEMLEILKGSFGDLVVTRGRKHAFIGMN